jgi:flagellar hook-associated protein FlgK
MFSLPAFIRKLYGILSTSEQEDVVSWTEDGEGVMIKSIERLCDDVLPQHFRHNNYNSFVRQVIPNSF